MVSGRLYAINCLKPTNKMSILAKANILICWFQILNAFDRPETTMIWPVATYVS
jgi:hypothetical protein